MQGTPIELDRVLDSKVYVHEKSQLALGSPRQYIEPFLNKFGNAGVKFNVKVAERVANKETTSDAMNEAYGRVLVEAKLPEEYCLHSHDSVIGLVYALDIQKPVVKIYAGQNAWACTNLAIFGAKYVFQSEIMSGIGDIYDKATEYVNEMREQLRRFNQIYTRMHETIYEGDEIDRTLGHLLREAYKNKQIGTNPVLSALKDLEDNKSKYAIKENKTSQWNIYSALTQYCTDKVDILETPSKTVAISNLFVRDI